MLMFICRRLLISAVIAVYSTCSPILCNVSKIPAKQSYKCVAIKPLFLQTLAIYINA